MELQGPKQAAAMKHAGKVGRKDPRPPAFGGGQDGLQVFLAERAAPLDAAVKDLAGRLQVLHCLAERQPTAPQSAGKHGPLKAAKQREELVAVHFPIKAHQH
eukprot:4184361-Pyramimonas_sp.AAC.1